MNTVHQLLRKNLARMCLPLVLITGAAFSACSSAPAADRHNGGARTPQTVAILDFEVRSGVPDYEFLASEIPSALAEAFLKGSFLRPVERSDLDRILKEQELELSDLVDEAGAIRVGRLAGARYVLVGSATIVASQVRIAARLVGVETSEIAWAGTAVGKLKDLPGLEAYLARQAEVALP